jgi:hypothetical protein
VSACAGDIPAWAGVGLLAFGIVIGALAMLAGVLIACHRENRREGME